MKRFLLFAGFVLIVFTSKSQIFIPQQYVGQNINQVIYYGTYSSTGNCTTGQDYDFDLVYSQISPFATGVELILDVHSMSGILTLNGNPVLEGSTYTLQEPAVPLHFQFGSSGAMDFSITATGTPTVAAETYPCYVVDKVSQFACNNTYRLMEGEIFIPCSVATVTVISENDFSEIIFFSEENNSLIFETVSENELVICDVSGKIIVQQKTKKRKNSFALPQLAKGIYFASLKNIGHLKFIISR